MDMSREERLALATINPEFEELFKNTPPAPKFDENTNIPAARAYWALIRASAKEKVDTPEEISYVEEDRQIPMRDGTFISVRIHSPKSPPSDGSPAFVVYHGGGFVFGDLSSEEILCRKWTELGGVAINVDYRLAPEHVFPAAVHDSYDALKWAAANIDDLKINPKKGFLVGGISAGANISAVISHLYCDDNISPPLTGVYLSIPAIMAEEFVPEKYKKDYLSKEQNKNAPGFNEESMRVFGNLYKAEGRSPLRSPILFESHKKLPPHYIQVCGLDPLRDEGLIYEEILRKENGIKTKLDIYPGLTHAFWGPYPEASFTKEFRKDCVNGMSWLLEQGE